MECWGTPRINLLRCTDQSIRRAQVRKGRASEEEVFVQWAIFEASSKERRSKGVEGVTSNGSLDGENEGSLRST